MVVLGGGACMVAPRGACVVAPRGACMVALGACMVALGGMHGCSGEACMVASGGCVWLLLGVRSCSQGQGVMRDCSGGCACILVRLKFKTVSPKCEQPL